MQTYALNTYRFISVLNSHFPGYCRHLNCSAISLKRPHLFQSSPSGFGMAGACALPRAPLRKGIPDGRFKLHTSDRLVAAHVFQKRFFLFKPSIIQAGKSKTSLKLTVTVYRLGKSCFNDCPHSIPCFKHVFFASFCHNKMPPLGISCKSLWFNPQIPVQPERCRA